SLDFGDLHDAVGPRIDLAPRHAEEALAQIHVLACRELAVKSCAKLDQRHNAARHPDLGSVLLSSRRRHTRCYRDWSSDVCSSDLSISAPPIGTPCSSCSGTQGSTWQDSMLAAGVIPAPSIACTRASGGVIGPVLGFTL